VLSGVFSVRKPHLYRELALTNRTPLVPECKEEEPEAINEIFIPFPILFR